MHLKYKTEIFAAFIYLFMWAYMCGNLYVEVRVVGGGSSPPHAFLGMGLRTLSLAAGACPAVPSRWPSDAVFTWQPEKPCYCE